MRPASVILVLSVLLTSFAAPVGAGHELRIRGATLADAEAQLVGRSGLVGRGEPFQARFERMRLGAQDAARLLELVQDVTKLPRRSEVKIEGTIDSTRFKATVERDKRGRAEVSLEGLRFVDQQQLLSLLTVLTRQGVTECTLRGFVADSPVEIKFKQEPAKSPETVAPVL